MRGLIWVVLLFAVAVVAATTFGRNDGLVSIFWAGWRTDVSLNFFVLSVLALCSALVVAAHALARLVSLPQRAREWREHRKEQAAHAVRGRFPDLRKDSRQVNQLLLPAGQGRIGVMQAPAQADQLQRGAGDDAIGESAERGWLPVMMRSAAEQDDFQRGERKCQRALLREDGAAPRQLRSGPL